MNIYHVYLHIKPEGRLEDIFYVGKGNATRVKLLCRRGNKHHTNIVNKYGEGDIIVRSLECESEEHAFALEVEMITILRRMGVNICNKTDGGEGTSGLVHSDASKKKMAASRMGQKHTLGFKHSEETKANLVAMGRAAPPPKTNTSGYKGVSWEKTKGKWRATIYSGGKTLVLGSYPDITDAINARKQGELNHWGIS